MWGDIQIWPTAPTGLVGPLAAFGFWPVPRGEGQRAPAGVVAPQTPGRVPDAVLAVKMAVDAHAQAGAGAAAGLLGELQRHRVEHDDVVLPHGAVFGLAEDLVEIDVADGDEGGGGIGRRPRELFVVGGDEVVAQIGVGGLERVDAMQVSSLTRRSCRVRLSRSTRPRACGE